MHAFGFLVVGVISGLVPRWIPSWCPPTGLDGSSTRELWLQVMCAVQVGLAGIYFLRRVGTWLATSMPYTYASPEISTVQPVGIAVPVLASPKVVRAWRPALMSRSRSRTALLPLPLPAGFEAGLLDQRAA